jgi:hypothetical protein
MFTPCYQCNCNDTISALTANFHTRVLINICFMSLTLPGNLIQVNIAVSICLNIYSFHIHIFYRTAFLYGFCLSIKCHNSLFSFSTRINLFYEYRLHHLKFSRNFCLVSLKFFTFDLLVNFINLKIYHQKGI